MSRHSYRPSAAGARTEEGDRRLPRRSILFPQDPCGLSRKSVKNPLFEEKLVDIVALYLDPPEHAIVLSVDEKSQIQALDRTPPGLPMKRGAAEP